MSKVVIGHGSGGQLTKRLIEQTFMPHIASPYLQEADDAAIVPIATDKIVMTTDAFTVHPLFFPGGDIGKLAVCGSVNDLIVCGARPRYLSVSFVIEEGFATEALETIMKSFAADCQEAHVEVVAADTKVVEHGKGDGVFISVCGVGEMFPEVELSAERVSAGDRIIVTGDIGDHGAAIVLARDELNIDADIPSDCASLHGLIGAVLKTLPKAIKQMRDATRGGVATVLSELASRAKQEMILFEKRLPIKEPVHGLCEMLGLSPLYLANEGTAVLIVDEPQTDEVLMTLQEHPLGRKAAVIGEVRASSNGRLLLETLSRGKRILDALVEDQLPRIC